jgi:hypothetical protein
MSGPHSRGDRHPRNAATGWLFANRTNARFLSGQRCNDDEFHDHVDDSAQTDRKLVRLVGCRHSRNRHLSGQGIELYAVLYCVYIGKAVGMVGVAKLAAQAA